MWILYGMLWALAATDPGPWTTEDGNWTAFRNGGPSTAATKKLPLHWSPAMSTGWQLELPGYGQSAVVVWRNHVYVTSVEGPNKEALLVSCIDLKTGTLLWKRSQDASQQAPSNYQQSRAAPTPVVDENGLYAFFESGDLLAFTHDGQSRWTSNLGKEFGPFENRHGLGASPTQTDSLVIVNLEHQGPSHLVAIDKHDGSVKWSAERPGSSSWSSPIATSIHGRSQVVVSSGGTVTGYDAADGSPLWQVNDVVGNSLPSPTPVGNGLLIAARLPEFGSAADAAKSNLCLEIAEDQTVQVKWRAQRMTADYASPVTIDDCVYVIDKLGILYCLDLETGETHYTERLHLEAWATPIAQPGRLYVFGKDGTTKVIKTGAIYRELATNHLWDAEHPPRPINYVENHSQAPTPEGAGLSMGERLKQGDKDGDGLLSADELPGRMQAAIKQYDKNEDGALDAAELEELAARFAARRSDSQANSRDPIVYGVAAAGEAFLVRTGTRLFCIRQEEVHDE